MINDRNHLGIQVFMADLRKEKVFPNREETLSISVHSLLVIPALVNGQFGHTFNENALLCFKAQI